MPDANTSRKWIAIVVVLLIAGLIGWIFFLLFVGGPAVHNTVASSSSPPPTAAEASQKYPPSSLPMVSPGANAIKVGWLVSQYIATSHFYGAGYFNHITAIHSLFVDPQIELFALVEPDSLNNPSQKDYISRYFLPNHTVILTDPAALAKMDVIVISRAFVLKEQDAEAFDQAVRNGTGLFIHVGLNRYEHSSLADRELMQLNDPHGRFIRPPIPCQVVSDHPLLAGLKSTLPDGRLSIAQFNGTIGILQNGTPLIVADSSPQDDLESSTHSTPSTQAAPRIYPLYIAHLGKGLIINCQWDSIPPELVEASKGRFYIHCCEYLAHRALD